MIKIIAIDGKNSPVILCDYCQKRIEDANNAIVIYRKNVANGEVPFVVAHKGECDTGATICFGDDGGTGELSTVLTWTMQNAGIREAEDIARAFEIADLMASI